MKVFITNKKYFEECFTAKNYRNGYYKTPKQIHQNLFKKILSDVSDNSIPILLDIEYKDGGYVLFEFKNKRNDIFFYEFISSAS